jgi:hypothetical protein
MSILESNAGNANALLDAVALLTGQSQSRGGVKVLNNNGSFAASATSEYSLKYPEDLGTSKEHGNSSVVFFVYVHSDGAIAKNQDNIKAGSKIDLRSVTAGDAGQRAAGAGNTVAENVSGGPISKIAGETLFSPIVPASYTQLGACIQLHMPATVKNTYSVNWETKDVSSMARKTGWAGAAADLVTPGKSGLAGLVDQAKSAAAIKAMGENYGPNLLGKTPGNAKEEQMFRGVNFRQFGFTYEFKPRSEAEAKNVLDIIRMFRHHMLPEYADNAKFIFTFPSRFQIVYFNGSEENSFIEKQMTAVLTSMDVSYGDGEVYTSYAGGMPSNITISLTFTEMGLATKETSPYDGLGV